MAKSPPNNKMKTEQEEIEALTKEFGALVDESLVLLIYREQGAQEAHRTLAQISRNVREEEASGFDLGDIQDSVEGARSPATHADTFSSWTTATTTTTDSSRSRSLSTTADELPQAMQALALPDTAARGSADLVATLKSVFPMLRDTDVQRAVKEAAGDAARASDILLNIKHLEETGERPKGIDGFFVPDEAPPPGSRKNRRKKKLPPQLRENARQKLPVDYKLAPGDGTDNPDELPATTATPVTAPAAPASTYVERAEVAQKSWAAAGASYESASAAYRRGRSDPLFRQVAAVYSDRGRAQAAVARQAQSAAADAFVDEQSCANTVDVHYVAVNDGVRIALERTQQWWARLGENRVKKAREDPLRVVTGSGVHSAQGFSRMYGEVGAALEREGWKVQPRTGHYFVTGKK